MTSPPPEKKPKKTLSKDDLMKLTKEELVSKLSDLLIYVDDLECKLAARNSSIGANSNLSLKKSSHQQNAIDSSSAAANATFVTPTSDGISQEERFRQQQLEASRRENVLVMRLTTKEQEVQDLLAQLEEMRAGVGNGVRNMLLDPAVNAIFQHMKHELQQTKDKLDQSLQELEAWKFTPDSKMGKRLMAKCRTLIQENDELGNMTSSGRIAKIDNELSAAKKVCEDLKNSQADIDGFLLELDEEMEGMQTQIVSLQRKNTELSDENRRLKEQMIGGCSSSSTVTTVNVVNDRTFESGRSLPEQIKREDDEEEELNKKHRTFDERRLMMTNDAQPAEPVAAVAKPANAEAAAAAEDVSTLMNLNLNCGDIDDDTTVVNAAVVSTPNCVSAVSSTSPPPPAPTNCLSNGVNTY